MPSFYLFTFIAPADLISASLSPLRLTSLQKKEEEEEAACFGHHRSVFSLSK